MEQIRHLAVLGGDQRQIYMTKGLMGEGYELSVWGLGKCHEALLGAEVCDTWERAIEKSDAVILPLPLSIDGVRVHCPLHDGEAHLRVANLLDAISGKVMLGGRISEPLYALAEKKGVRPIDYYDCELLQQKNAIPTAEGAIAIAMQALPITIDRAEVAVLGYGRIGKLLSAKLSVLGAYVTVYARRREVLSEASLYHHKTALLSKREGRAALSSFPEGCRAVFNTIPERLIANDDLDVIPPDCLYVDLASAPGGIDHTAAAARGIKTVWGTALPGKCAPETAGKIISEAIVMLLESLS